MPSVREFLAPVGRLFRVPLPFANGHSKSGAPRVAKDLPIQPEFRTIGKIVEEMRKDYQVTFSELILWANLVSVKLTIAVAKDKQRTEEYVTPEGVETRAAPDALATAIASSLQQLWDESLSGMRDSIAYGRVAHEKVWHYCEPEANEDGSTPSYHTIRKLESLPFDRTKLKLEEGVFAGIEAKVKSGEWETIPTENSWWLALNATTTHPHGNSRFIPAPYEVYKDKLKAKRNRTTAISKWAVRGPVFRGPIVDTDEQTQEQFDVLERMSPALEQHSKGAALYLPNDVHPHKDDKYKYTVDQPELKGLDPSAINSSMERYDVEMLRAFGIPEQTVIEAGAVGTYGSIAQKMLILFATVEEILKELRNSYVRYVIEKVEEINGLPKGTIEATFVSLTNRPDSFVFEIIKLLLANPSFIEVVLSGGLDVPKILEQAGLPVTDELKQLMLTVAQRLAAAGAAQLAAAGVPAPGASAALSPGEFGDMGRRQFTNNVKAIRDILNDLIAQKSSEAMTRELLESLGLAPERVDRLIADATDNQQIDDPELQEAAKAMSDEASALLAKLLT